MNKQARQRFLKFAESPGALWPANFRDLNAAVTRMSTLAPGGRITVAEVEEEIFRLQAVWHGQTSADRASILHEVLTEDQVTALDLFDRAQLETVLHLCRESKSLSDAGRKLFSISRQAKKQPNDADRLRKYLVKFGIAWGDVQSRESCHR